MNLLPARLRLVFWERVFIWTILYSTTLIALGLLASFGSQFDLHGLPLYWMVSPPACYFVLALGLFGLYLVFNRSRFYHVIFAVLNVFFWFNVALGFQFELRLGTVIYVIIGLGGSIWLMYRTMVDYRKNRLYGYPPQ